MAEASDPASNTTLSSMDRQEIMDLVYNYSYTYDSKDLEGWLALFAEGAIWSVYAGGSSDPKIVTVSNQERRMLLGPSLEGNQTRHFMTNTILRQTDVDRAEGKTMFCCFITQEPSSSSSSSSGAVSSSPFGVAESVQMSHHLIVTGYYEDEFVRTENGVEVRLKEDEHRPSPHPAPAHPAGRRGLEGYDGIEPNITVAFNSGRVLAPG